jgi:hypothetical protein
LPTWLLALATFAALTYTKEIPEPLLIAAAGLVGFLLHGNSL